ncbi:MAG: bifunctional metallophosphatase/5'-nucleotidase [Clostridiales bacterium]|jgi:2',3'-cyclic-nucleotide 2'-phosphodiesterase (5'-nucleotidase family)|nr:bifunctional metallophosphatase/5'-nucleotidase [Clostridiales bacterium]
MRRILASLFIASLLLLPAVSMAAPPSDEVTILFTHDLHSNFLPFKLMQGDAVTHAGGFARLQTRIDQERAGADVLLVDAGDFSMGTLFQTLYASFASELRMLGLMGYDAVTLGNHEFDWGAEGLTDMLHTAADSGETLPSLLFDAGDFAYTQSDDPQTLLENLSDAFARVNTQKTLLVDKNGVKIGIFSTFGKDAADVTPLLPFPIPAMADAAKQSVADLKAQGAELIICLSHGGTNEDPKKSEDELLAAAVPDIDVIISGHTHTLLQEPIMIGDTLIVSCNEYGKYLGKLVLRKNGARWAAGSYALLPIDESIPEEAATAQEITKYKGMVEQQYLKHFNSMKYDQVLAHVPFSSLEFDIYTRHGESLLGNFISDAYMAAVTDGERPALAVAPAGLIRAAIPMGDVTLADLFNVNSLGIGADGLTDYPLIDVYLTGQELYNVAEVDASVTPLMPDAQLFMSGLNFRYNPNRLPLNKVTEAYLTDAQGNRAEIERDRLYRVICSLYAAQMLGSVKEKTFGIVSLTPKDEAGNEITDYYARILHDATGAEIKGWYALASFASSFEKNDRGVSIIPDYYNQTHARKVAETETGLGIHFTNTNIVFNIIAGAILVVLMALIIFIYRFATRKKRKSWRRKHGR